MVLKTSFIINICIFYTINAAEECFTNQKFPKVFQYEDPTYRADSSFQAIAAHDGLNAIFIGGRAAQEDLVGEDA